LVSEVDGSVTYAASDDAEVYSVVDEIARRALGARRDELPGRAPGRHPAVSVRLTRRQPGAARAQARQPRPVGVAFALGDSLEKMIPHQARDRHRHRHRATAARRRFIDNAKRAIAFVR
jgi:hypothetical protein